MVKTKNNNRCLAIQNIAQKLSEYDDINVIWS